MSSSFFVNLRSKVCNLLSPWMLSDSLFHKVRAPSAQKNLHHECEVLPSDPEWDFVHSYFFQYASLTYSIKRVFCVHNPLQTEQFEASLVTMDGEAQNPFFSPKWPEEDPTGCRAKVVARWRESANAFSPVVVVRAGTRKETLSHVFIFPYWHGSNQEKVQFICDTGFAYFGKHSYLQGAGDRGPSTDVGFFGSGIYFTNSARYAADIYSSGRLLLAWVSMRSPYPVIEEEAPDAPSDRDKLQGGPAFENYDAHYVPIIAMNTSNPVCPAYTPCRKDQVPMWDEIVVFHKSQTLPRFYVELMVTLPTTPISPVVVLTQLLEYLQQLSKKPEVAENPGLLSLFQQEKQLLFVVGDSSHLSSVGQKFFDLVRQLQTGAAKLDKCVIRRFLALTPSYHQDACEIEAARVTPVAPFTTISSSDAIIAAFATINKEYQQFSSSRTLSRSSLENCQKVLSKIKEWAATILCKGEEADQEKIKEVERKVLEMCEFETALLVSLPTGQEIDSFFQEIDQAFDDFTRTKKLDPVSLEKSKAALKKLGRCDAVVTELGTPTTIAKYSIVEFQRLLAASRQKVEQMVAASSDLILTPTQIINDAYREFQQAQSGAPSATTTTAVQVFNPTAFDRCVSALEKIEASYRQAAKEGLPTEQLKSDFEQAQRQVQEMNMASGVLTRQDLRGIQSFTQPPIETYYVDSKGEKYIQPDHSQLLTFGGKFFLRGEYEGIDLSRQQVFGGKVCDILYLTKKPDQVAHEIRDANPHGEQPLSWLLPSSISWLLPSSNGEQPLSWLLPSSISWLLPSSNGEQPLSWLLPSFLRPSASKRKYLQDKQIMRQRQEVQGYLLRMVQAELDVKVQQQWKYGDFEICLHKQLRLKGLSEEHAWKSHAIAFYYKKVEGEQKL